MNKTLAEMTREMNEAVAAGYEGTAQTWALRIEEMKRRKHVAGVDEVKGKAKVHARILGVGNSHYFPSPKLACGKSLRSRHVSILATDKDFSEITCPQCLEILK